jgi:hypothetical protein
MDEMNQLIIEESKRTNTLLEALILLSKKEGSKPGIDALIMQNKRYHGS